MKLRAKNGFYLDRMQSQCTCLWCNEPFVSQRSDSKYCCDSHKTMASNKRQDERRERERNYYEQQEQMRIARKKAATINSIKSPETISKVLEEPSPDVWAEFETSMKEMVLKTELEHRLRDQQRELDFFSKMFEEIARRMKSCAQTGLIRYTDISALQYKVSRILNDPKLHVIEKFQEHLKFVEGTLAPYIEELYVEYRESPARRLEFNPARNIIYGLEFLGTPVQFSVA